MRQKLAHGAKADLSQKRIEMERRILKSKMSKSIITSSNAINIDALND